MERICIIRVGWPSTSKTFYQSQIEVEDVLTQLRYSWSTCVLWPTLYYYIGLPEGQSEEEAAQRIREALLPLGFTVVELQEAQPIQDSDPEFYEVCQQIHQQHIDDLKMRKSDAKV